LCIGLLCMILAGCATTQNTSSEKKGDKPTQANDKEKNEENDSNNKKAPQKKDPIQTKINNMNLEEKIAQMMFVGLNGKSLSEQEAEMLRTEHVGGVILLGGNIQNQEQLLEYVTNIKKASENSGPPLMRGVDDEGGRVSRIPESIVNFPSNQFIGDQADASLSHEIGELLAQKAKVFGFNVNFAPVLDINNNPQNTVIGDRSFGSTPEKVSKLGIATMKGIKSEKVIPVVKHFPGHGNTLVDSHKQLPKVDKSMVDIKSEEIVPFRKAINEGTEMVMVAHILYSAIDQEYPATLSERVITGLLRDDMGFEGVVITDDMSMGAITQNYGMEEAAVLSIGAGADMFMLTSSGNGNYERVKNALKEAVEKGVITEGSLNASVKRVLKVKKQYGLSHELPQSVDVSNLNKKIRNVKNRIK